MDRVQLDAWASLLARELPGNIERDVLLAPFTTFRIGGPADLYYAAGDAEALARAVTLARQHGVPYFLLGLGANILIGDRGVRGLVIHNQARGVGFEQAPEGELTGRVTAESGTVVWPDLIEAAISQGLSGLEHYAGIPSSVGGALWQNLHFLSPAPERERTMFIEEVLESAEVLLESGSRKTVGVDWFDFGYDQSVLHHRRHVVLSATFRLEPGRPEADLRRIVTENLSWRAERHPPLDTEPSAGSIFQKIEGIGAGRLIDECGLKGKTVGGARVSPRHANIFVNTGEATAADVRHLIEEVREHVARKTGHELQVEISFVGEF